MARAISSPQRKQGGTHTTLLARKFGLTFSNCEWKRFQDRKNESEEIASTSGIFWNASESALPGDVCECCTPGNSGRRIFTSADFWHFGNKSPDGNQGKVL
jgi:hypothetical protein